MKVRIKSLIFPTFTRYKGIRITRLNPNNNCVLDCIGRNLQVIFEIDLDNECIIFERDDIPIQVNGSFVVGLV